jgi:putative transposase
MMPRQARLLIPGVPLHVIQRGHNRQHCFDGDSDRLHYLHTLRTYSALMGISIHAYVLMTNHVHLLMSLEYVGVVGDFMKAVGQRHTHFMNRRRNATGTLWEGRFRSCPVPTERYLMTCQRYIELNPVRARMVECAEQYPWSSHRANAGLCEDSTVEPHYLYLNLGMTTDARHGAYRDLFLEPPPLADVEEIRRASNGNTLPGRGARKLGRPSKRANHAS